jgi:hypothetical protein
LAHADVKREHMKKLNRYKENLRIDGDRVISYSTHVATIEGSTLRVLGSWSKTTTKHINYVAAELDLIKLYSEL